MNWVEWTEEGFPGNAQESSGSRYWATCINGLHVLILGMTNHTGTVDYTQSGLDLPREIGRESDVVTGSRNRDPASSRMPKLHNPVVSVSFYFFISHPTHIYYC